MLPPYLETLLLAAYQVTNRHLEVGSICAFRRTRHSWYHQRIGDIATVIARVQPTKPSTHAKDPIGAP